MVSGLFRDPEFIDIQNKNIEILLIATFLIFQAYILYIFP